MHTDYPCRKKKLKYSDQIWDFYKELAITVFKSKTRSKNLWLEM